MTTKFNQSMYAWMRARKNEPLSNLGAKNVQATEKGGPITTGTPSTPRTEAMRMALKTLQLKRLVLGVKGNKPRTSRRRRLTPDLLASRMTQGLLLSKVQDTFTAEYMKVFSGVPANEVLGRHLHKLVRVLGESFHITYEYFA